MSEKYITVELKKRIKELEKEIVVLNQTEKVLKESEHTYRSLFGNSELLHSIYDKNGVCLKMV